MRHLLVLLIIGFCSACKNDPNQQYIDKVAEKVKTNEMELDVGYRNIEFEWIDTVIVDGVITEYHARNTYRLMVGMVDEKITAEVIFDPDFNIIKMQ